MALNDVLDDCQAKAGATRCKAASRIGAVEPPGQVRYVLRSNSCTPINHFQLGIAAGGLRKPHSDRGFATAIFIRIVDKIPDELFQLLLVTGYFQGTLQVEVETRQTAFGCGRIARSTFDNSVEQDRRMGTLMLLGFDP